MIETTILKIKGDWEEVVDDCRFTANKGALGHEPSDKFKKRALISEHSPIRGIIFKWEWREIKHWTVVHWVRHKWECYVNTQRVDRTGVDRDSMRQDSPQNFRGEANIQHLIDTMRKRLCFKASKETREEAVSLKYEIKKKDNLIANVLVPNCIYRGGCPEHDISEENRCKFYENFVKDFPSDKCIYNIQDRYDVYNEEESELYGKI